MGTIRHVDLDRVLQDIRAARETEERAEPRSIEWLRARYRVLAGEEILSARLEGLPLEDVAALTRTDRHPS
jgi:hypothetical protein